MSVNKVILVGNLGNDPELRYTPNGHPMARWRMATSRRWKDKDGNESEETQWHNVKVWGGIAESCEKYLAKGRQVYVEGRIETREYEQEGVKKYFTEVVAQTVRFLGGGGGKGGGRTSEAAPPLEAPPYEDADIPF